MGRHLAFLLIDFHDTSSELNRLAGWDGARLVKFAGMLLRTQLGLAKEFRRPLKCLLLGFDYRY